jgi:hypothetical protein
VPLGLALLVNCREQVISLIDLSMSVTVILRQLSPRRLRFCDAFYLLRIKYWKAKANPIAIAGKKIATRTGG